MNKILLASAALALSALSLPAAAGDGHRWHRGHGHHRDYGHRHHGSNFAFYWGAPAYSYYRQPVYYSAPVVYERPVYVTQPAPAYASAPAPDDQYCREYQKTMRVGGHLEEGYGTACMQPDGSWEIQP